MKITPAGDLVFTKDEVKRLNSAIGRLTSTLYRAIYELERETPSTQRELICAEANELLNDYKEG